MGSVDRVLAGARLNETSPGWYTRHIVQRPTHRLSLRSVGGDVAVRILESTEEVKPELGFWDRQFYFLARVDLVDGRGSQYVAINRRSAHNFLVANGVQRVQDVAETFWNLDVIEDNCAWFERVSPAKWELKGHQYDDVVRISQDLNRDVEEVIEKYKELSKDILPLFVDPIRRKEHFEKQIVAQILGSYVSSRGIDYEKEFDSYLDHFLGYVHMYQLSLEQVLDSYVKATGLWGSVEKKRAETHDSLSFNDLLETLLFLEKKHQIFDQIVARRAEHLPAHISSKHWGAKLPRSLIYFNQKGCERGRAFLCFNKHGRKAKGFTRNDDLLGFGTFCRVKEVMDLETGEIFAMVVQRDSLEARREFADQCVLQEGPGIAEVYGYAVWDGTIDGRRAQKMGIIMPKYERDLFQALYESGLPLSYEERFQMACEVMEGSNWIHRSGKIHRDLKPENILIDGENHAVIADFGHMQTIGAIQTIHGVSPVYTAPEYMEMYLKWRKDPSNPEALKKCVAAITPALDAWSVGLILWSLFEKELDANGVFDRKFRDYFTSTQWKDPFEENWLKGKHVDGEIGTIAEIIRGLLQPDPSKRLSVDVALKQFKNVRQPREAWA